MRALAGALGFFSTLPVGRDEKSFDALRRNLHVLPVVGVILGLIMAIPTLFIFELAKDLSFLTILVYLAIEGINHIDGLADFGDALFAPKDRKTKALKDLKTGVGGTVAVCIYVLTLMHAFSMLREYVIIALIDSQMMAKFGMLLLLTTTKPIWEGMASCMMEFARKSDLLLGLLTVIIFTTILFRFCNEVIFVNVLIIVLCLVYRFYVVRTFGGVNGDIVGALNCIAFATGLISFLAFHL